MLEQTAYPNHVQVNRVDAVFVLAHQPFLMVAKVLARHGANVLHTDLGQPPKEDLQRAPPSRRR